MTLIIGRRGLLRGTGVAAIAAGALPYDLALAQPAAPNTTLRVGMTASAVPLSNGVPDQGGEGHRFMGITLYDQLVMWDLSKSDAPATLRPGLAMEWRNDPADRRRWIVTLREGVRFHDGKPMDAADVVFSFDRAFRSDVPHYDPRANAQARIRMPTIASWRAEGRGTFVLETTRPDSFVPYGLTWVGITHQGAWEAAGATGTASCSAPSAPGPGSWRASPSASAA
jgi:ABC-type transport system substrate-binding protein